jgi:cellulose synthase operon protein YhjQ
MTETPPEPDRDALSEDISTLYSQAHLQGTRYWDFSASRNEVQGQFRHRIAREHAERAGAEPPPVMSASARQFMEPGHVPQFQPPPQPIPFEAQVRSGPVLAPLSDAPEPEADALEMSETATGRPSGPNPVAGPRREPLPPPREEVPTRWYALHSFVGPAKVALEPPVTLPKSFTPRPPFLAVFSVAGGVGKTCLVATLGRALSALGEHVLLADTAAWGLLPFYFGSRVCKPGVVRTFSPPSLPSQRPGADAPVQLLSLQAERYPRDDRDYDPLLARLVRDGRGVSRILVDVNTAGKEVVSRLQLLRPTVLVPMLPDMNSVASLVSLETLLAHPADRPGRETEQATSFYVLNQFDSASRLHLDVREILQQRLGDRLLPFVLRRNTAVSEALAEGMTVIDYASDSAVAEDYRHLAGWLRSIAAPASVGEGGLRWSER